MPTTTVTTVTTVTTIEEDIPPSDICECHKIDWSGGPKNYKYVDTGEPVDHLKDTFSCQNKCNSYKMSLGTYEEVCQYIPGHPGTKFPDHVYKTLGDPPFFPSEVCECHKIDWSDPRVNRYVDTGELVDDLKDTFSCQTKVNKGKMGLGTYEKVCQYIPGKIGTKFPDHVYKIMRGDAHATQTDP